VSVEQKRRLDVFEDLLRAARAALAYDAAIRSCADEPGKMASFCTAEGSTLDMLYADWCDTAAAAIAKYEGHPDDAPELDRGAR
jgi:hypothetical protein